MALPLIPLLAGGLGAMALVNKMKKNKKRSQDARAMQVCDVTGDTQAMRKGGAVKKMAKGGMTRGDGCCVRGKTKGRMC